ncbi:MAG TPA: hypothetical protein VIL65_15510 [Beijerinckiaceae bacterium]|jgi:hypothetical protein
MTHPIQPKARARLVGRLRVLLLAVMLAPPTASRAVTETPEPRAFAACEQADGALLVRAAEAAPVTERCHALDLPQGAAPRWVGWLGGAPAASGRVTVEGLIRDGVFVPRAARSLTPAAPDAARPWPLLEPLLSRAVLRPYGVEERAEARREGKGLVLTCRAGEKPAGVVLDLSHAPVPGGAALAWRWRVSGGSNLTLGVAPARDEAATRLVALREKGELPAWGEAPALLVAACPATAGEATILDLRLEHRLPKVTPSVSRALWAWRPERWRDQPEALLDALTAKGADRVFVTLTIEEAGGVAHAEALARFVERAQGRGIAVVAVEGDPAMALAAGRTVALARLAAIAAYQRAAPPGARLAGIQYDVEPYLLPAFAEDAPGVLRGWAETIDALAAAAPAELDMVVPFWLAGDRDAAASVLPALARVAGRVTVMAYRTEAAAIQAAATGFLAWGERVGRPVVIALEAGPVDDEATRVFAPAARGTLHLVATRDGRRIAALLDAEREGQPSAVLRLEREVPAPGAWVSFLGDEARLTATAASVAPGLAAWSSFAGFAWHGVID